MDAVFLQNRITALKLQIVAYEEAILALTLAGGVQSYTIDTQQGRQTVTRSDIGTLQRNLDSLMNMLITYEYRLNGGNVTIARPAF